MIESFTNAVKEMAQHKEGCYHWWVETDNNGNNWAIVLGWQDGYEEDDEWNETDSCWDFYNDSRGDKLFEEVARDFGISEKLFESLEEVA